MPLIGVLGLQGAIAEHRRALSELGADSRTVRRPAELSGLDGLVVPGGESTTMSKLALDLGLTQPIREAIAAGLPAFGTCAGMIMLAERVLDGRPDQQQFGGLDITTRRNAFGRQVESFEAPVEVLGLEQPFPGVFIRAPWVEEVGSGVTVLATVRRGMVDRVVALRSQTVLATAFHPELTPDRRLHQLFLELVEQ